MPHNQTASKVFCHCHFSARIISMHAMECWHPQLGAEKHTKTRQLGRLRPGHSFLAGLWKQVKMDFSCFQVSSSPKSCLSQPSASPLPFLSESMKHTSPELAAAPGNASVAEAWSKVQCRESYDEAQTSPSSWLEEALP